MRGTLNVRQHQHAVALVETAANYVYEIFSGLVSLSPDLEVVPDLAQGWETSPSGDVYTFTLRSGLFFHDGRPLRATDVAFAIERACDPRTGSPVASTYLGDIVGCDEKLSGNAAAVEGIRVVDDRRIALRIDPHIKLLPCVATNKESVKNVLLELLYSILEEMEANEKRK